MDKDNVIYDNHKRGILQDFLRKNIDENTKASFVSAYFTIDAYYALMDEFDKMQELRFLFGEPNFVKKVNDFLHYKTTIIEKEELKVPIDRSIKQSKAAKACAEWIREKVEIRSIKKPNFLHGKTYILENTGKIQPTAVIGSSNFTYKGLGCGLTPNMELNLKLSDQRDVNEVLSWFNEIWSDAKLVEDVKEEVLKSIEQLYKENSPEFIYFKTLYHIFDEFLKSEDDKVFALENKNLLDSQIWETLYDFQKDAVRGIINRINTFGGCILADGVGLGKTFEALAVIKYFANKGHRVLVLCPKKLQENWNQYRYTYKNNILRNDNFHYTVLAHTDLCRESGLAGDIELKKFMWEGYDLIVIDESHNFKNNKKYNKDSEGKERYTRYGKLMEEVLKKGVTTRVLLLSATPVNNSLADLKSQINLICKEDDTLLKEQIEITSLDYTIKSAQTKFNNWTENKNKGNNDKRNLVDILDNDFFKLLDSISIARSRKHIISKYEKTLKIIGNFPIKNKPLSVSSEIDTDNKFPNYDRLYIQIANFKLHLYKPAIYVNNEFKNEYDILYKRKEIFGNQATSEKFLTMMMRINYLKRLESSIDSFRSSIKRTLDKYDADIKKLESFVDPTNQELMDSLDFEMEFEDIGDEKQEELEGLLTMGKKLKYKLKHLDTDRFISALKNDRDVLEKIYIKSVEITPERDAKLQKVKELISTKMKRGENNNNKKVLIFTAFSDTAKYLYDNLHNWATKKHYIHSAIITGDRKNNKSTLNYPNNRNINSFEDILINFSPISKSRKEFLSFTQDCEIDLLIATDCISEGQNLQDCDYLINYDIHWNPVRIIQRFGRIDRIGSKNKSIQLVNCWPTNDLDKYINLKNRVEDRMRLVEITGSGDDIVSPELDPKESEKYDYRLKLLERLQTEVLTPDDSDDAFSLTDFSLQDYRVDLTNYLENNRPELKDAPLGLHAIVPPLSANLSRVDKSIFNHQLESVIQPGVIFCLKHKEVTDKAKKTLDKINPISPYYLIYILESGDVRLSFTNVKQILEIYNLLCKDQATAYEKLCTIFNKEVEKGDFLAHYTDLVRACGKAIMDKTEKKNAAQIANQRGAILLDNTNKANKADDFELITWLIIKKDSNETSD